jgi:hypothetical protein
MYKSIPSSISFKYINSSAECDRKVSPGPNFKDLQLKTDWAWESHKLIFLKRFLLAPNRDFQEWMTNLNSWSVA